MKRYRYKHKKYSHRKPHRVRKKKLIFKNKFFWLGLLFLAILGTAFYFVVFSSVFKIKEIQISGDLKISVEEIKNIISEQINKNYFKKSIFLVNLKEINRVLLERFPQIAKISLERGFPDVLAVLVEERKPVAVFLQARPSFVEQNLGGQGEDYYFVDNEGIAFEKISETPSQMLKIKNSTWISDLELGKGALSKEKLGQILKIETKLNDLEIPLREVLIISEKRLNVETSEYWEIYFNPEEDLDWQLTELDLLVKKRIPPDKRKNLEYIDLRFEKIYIFPETYKE